MTSYLDKVFREPAYIWQSGQCDLDLIASTIEHGQLSRLQWLAGADEVDAQTTYETQPDTTSDVVVRAETPSNADLAPATPPDHKTQETTPSSQPAIQPPVQVSSIQIPAQAVASRNTVVPLLTYVWNGAEPQNYVSQIQI